MLTYLHIIYDWSHVPTVECLVVIDTIWPASLRYLLPGLLQKNFADLDRQYSIIEYNYIKCHYISKYISIFKSILVLMSEVTPSFKLSNPTLEN